jgi:hypothetical protein
LFAEAVPRSGGTSALREAPPDEVDGLQSNANWQVSNLRDEPDSPESSELWDEYGTILRSFSACRNPNGVKGGTGSEPCDGATLPNTPHRVSGRTPRLAVHHERWRPATNDRYLLGPVRSTLGTSVEVELVTLTPRM